MSDTPDDRTPALPHSIGDIATHTEAFSLQQRSAGSTTSEFHGSEVPWPVGFTFLNEFVVEGVLGQGGMGTVYLVSRRSSGERLAVKRARTDRPDRRNLLLAELQTWVGLPEHPHLAACRFFRTVGEEVVLFTDYAAGGSLQDWIRSGKLAALEQILDVAIQVAWGLHALHEWGLVHQDVKPANVLLTPEGQARVADFGLARARAGAAAADPTGSVLVTAGPMTPAYCSPEQFGRRTVSRKTDVWSWGITVLEMFAGGIPCCAQGGHRAVDAFAGYLARGPTGRLPPMPAEVIAVLGRCFQPEPADRWGSLALAAQALVGAYQQLIGNDYPRPAPGLAARPPAEGVPHDREEMPWDPPRKWLCLALRAEGRDPTEVESLLPPAALSRKARAVADLAAYDQAGRMLQRLAEAGRMEMELSLASLYIQKAFVHIDVGDLPGALALYDRAIAVWERLVYHERRQEHTNNLARSYLHKGNALRQRGDNRGAVAVYDRIVALHERLNNRRRRRELSDDLAAAYLNKGIAVRSLGDVRTAVALYDKAITLWEVAEREGRPDAPNELARAYLTRASAVSALGESQAALELCDRAISLRERLVRRKGRRDLEGDLARAYLHKANALRALDNPGRALPLYDQALAIWERLVGEEGREDLAYQLARACLNKAGVLRALSDHRGAAELCGRAAALLEQLVHQEGRQELSHDLARAYLQRGNALRAAGQAAEALELCDRAVAIWERLLHDEGSRELANDLARAYSGKAHALRVSGNAAAAVPWFDKAIDLRGRLVDEEGRTDLRADLVRDRISRAEALLECGDRRRGHAELTEAAELLEGEAARAWRPDLASVLQRARRILAELGNASADS
jgi:serine/threonine protein kinase/tetratricopeptide (TPR) repeat protein